MLHTSKNTHTYTHIYTYTKFDRTRVTSLCLLTFGKSTKYLTHFLFNVLEKTYSIVDHTMI